MSDHARAAVPPPAVPVEQAVAAYERWLGGIVPLIAADLAVKHERMAKSAFMFLRATFHRWAERFAALCPDLHRAPAVLAVGDLHVENFGTWRDAEGRLAWGINDFDEAATLPYANDLVRLAASAELAARDDGLAVKQGDACEAILAGYDAALQQGGSPFVLGERHTWLRELAVSELRDPARFWEKLDGAADLPPGEIVPPEAAAALASALPAPDLPARVVHRLAGLGSLGRPRYLALAEWRGGRIAREVKPLAPSAWRFAGGPPDDHIHYDALLARAVRDPDPFARVEGTWIVRRLSPDCSRVELAALSSTKETTKLLRAMGHEAANVHLGTTAARDAIREDLARRPAGWLHAASSRMVAATVQDFEAWQAAWKHRPGP